MQFFLKELFEGSTLKVDSMKSKADLYLIDFKKNPIKSNALAIISFGFYTRKKAKETKERVIEERKRLLRTSKEFVENTEKLIKIKIIVYNFYDNPNLYCNFASSNKIQS